MAMESTLANTNWYPSGNAFATRAVPVMPPAPLVFSMITCWPSASEMPTARMRPAVSEELPAAKGTTMVTGRAGQFCADAALIVAMAARVQSAKRLGLNIIRSPWIEPFVGNPGTSKKRASLDALSIFAPSWPGLSGASTSFRGGVARKTWMPATSAGMTVKRRFDLIGTRPNAAHGRYSVRIQAVLSKLRDWLSRGARQDQHYRQRALAHRGGTPARPSRRPQRAPPRTVTSLPARTTGRPPTRTVSTA